MAIHFAKARNKRVPLTPQEQALARTLYESIQRATDKMSIKQLESLLRNMDPATLERLLNSITIANQKKIQESLINSIDLGGKEAIEQIKSIAPKLALPAFLPSKVKIDNKPAMANMEFTQLPAWAQPKPPKVEFTMSFNKTNPNSLAFAQRRAGELVTSIDALTRLSVRKAIIDAFNEGLDYRATARRIKSVVGLHPRFADAVTNFEKREYARLVKSGVKEATARAKAIERSTRYSDSLKSKRATMIARTEIQIAQNEGRQEGWNQAAEQGYVDVESQKMWVIAQDERTCDICSELDGEIVPWNETFSSGHETPGRVHPNCRCTMVIIPPERRSK
jgi:SPP1 gp7 family putative phage head morphogenesis protein